MESMTSPTKWHQPHILMYKVDTFVMGDDWKGKFDSLTDICNVVYLPRTPEISTTKIKHDLDIKILRNQNNFTMTCSVLIWYLTMTVT